jgi:hypothetical protein
MFAVDLFAKRNGLQIDDLKKAKRFSARLLAERKGILVLPGEFAQDLFLTGQEPPELEVRSSGEKLREERTPESDDPEQKNFEEGNVFTVSPAVSADDALHLIGGENLSADEKARRDESGLKAMEEFPPAFNDKKALLAP